jgi:predicted AlkP superfamily phosphohydrolase/phosphomutase
MLSNSLVAAGVATAYVLILVALVNPALRLNPLDLEPLVATVGLYYLVHLTAVAYVLLVIRQLLAHEVFSPAWISIRELGWLCGIAAAAGAALMWRNLQTFTLVLDARTATALDRSALMLAATAILLALLAAVRRRDPQPRLVVAPALVLIVAGSIAGPLAVRGRGVAPLLEARPIDAPFDSNTVERSAHVTVIAVDAGSLDFITRATAEGRLPNFGRILDAGAVRRLATLNPTSAEAVWAAVATGKLPQKNGVRSAGIYAMARGGSLQLLPDYCFAHGLERFGLVVEEPHTSAAFRTRTLWSILTTDGYSVGVVGWPLTRPAPVVRGYLVSDTYHRFALSAAGLDDANDVYPPELQGEAASAMDHAVNDPPQEVVGASFAEDARQATPARTDRIYDRIATTLARARPTQVTLTRFQSLDPIGHYYLRYAIPSEFGDVTDEERRKLGPVLNSHYAIVDEAIGRAMAALEPDDLLLVVSGYGMEPLSVGRRLIERVIGDPDVSGTHDTAPDGFLMAYGAPVARSRRLEAAASVVDVVPTILYFLGLPIGRDMDGFARTDLFERSFTNERPITFIPTYDR